MFTRLALTTLLAALAVVRADPNPSEPDSTTVENVGQTCHIQWDVDTTGVWKEMYIELMTGDNFQMVHLTTVGKVDGTDANNATLDWTCPDVTPNSAIYFYQFRSPAAGSATYWTTRFTIAAADGSTTAPTNAKQPSTNDAIPWGTGAFVDPSLATAAPDLSSSSSSNTTSGATTSAGTASSGTASSGAAPGVTTSAGTTAAVSPAGGSAATRAVTSSRTTTSAAGTASASTTASSETSDASRAVASIFALGASVVALALAL